MNTISSIGLNGVKTLANLDLVTGDISFNEDPEKTFVETKSMQMPLTTDYKDFPYDLMVEAGPTTFEIFIVVEGVTFNGSFTMTDTHAGEAGYKHRVNITFDGSLMTLQTPEMIVLYTARK